MFEVSPRAWHVHLSRIENANVGQMTTVKVTR